MPRLEFDSLTPQQARRLADIADALVEGGLPVVALVDAHRYELPARCPDCGRALEAGWCYRCHPVWGYSGAGRD